MSETVFVTLGGAEVPVVIEGGNLIAGASVALQDLNQAVGEAEQAASDASDSALEANIAAATAIAATNNKVNLPGDNLSPANTRALRFKLGDRVIDPENYDSNAGTGGDDTAAITQWVNEAATYGLARHISGRTYNVNPAANLALGQGIIYVDQGAVISGGVQPKSATVGSDRTIIRNNSLTLNINANGAVQYVQTLSPTYVHTPDNKQVWIENPDYSTVESVDLSTVVYETVAYPNASDFTADTPSTSAVTVVWNLTNNGRFRFGWVPFKAGAELGAQFGESGTEYNRAAGLKTSNGWIVAFYSSNAGITIAETLRGGGTNTVAITDWPGKTTLSSFYSGKAFVSIKTYDRYTYGILINGVEVAQRTVPSGVSFNLGYIIQQGLGAFGNVVLTVGANYWSRLIHKKPSNGVAINGVVCGDSTVEPWPGQAVSYLVDALEGIGGIRVQSMDNIAVGGETVQQQRTRLLATSLTGKNLVLIFAGTNNIQAGEAPSVTIPVFEEMINYAQAANCKVVIGVPGMYYTSAVAGGYGFATSNYDGGTGMRAAIKEMCGRRGVGMIDVSSLYGAALPAYIGAPGLSDAILRDAIHETPLSGRKKGIAAAKKVAALFFPKIEDLVSEGDLSGYGYRNGWVAGGEGARLSIEGGRVYLSGFITSGTATTGTIAYVFPYGLRPKTLKRFVVRANGGNVQMSVNPTGELFFDETPGGAIGAFLVLDNMSWDAK